MMAAHKVDATAAIARTDVGFSARGQCCGSNRIGIARCGQRRRGRDGDRLLGRRRLRAYRDCVNGLRHVGKLFRDRSRRRTANGFRQHSKVVRDRARRCQQIRLLRRLICMPRRLNVRAWSCHKMLRKPQARERLQPHQVSLAGFSFASNRESGTESNCKARVHHPPQP